MSGDKIIKVPLDSKGELKTLRYEASRSGKPPIPITVAPPAIEPPLNLHPAFRGIAQVPTKNDKRDSGLAPMTPMIAREGSFVVSDEHIPRYTTLTTSVIKSKSSPSLVQSDFADHGVRLPRTLSFQNSNNVIAPKNDRHQGAKTPDLLQERPGSSTVAGYSPITTPIPSDDLGMDFMEKATFSKRGSMLLVGKEVVIPDTPPILSTRGTLKKSASMLPSTQTRSVDRDLELQSQKVRSMYETGPPMRWENGSPTIQEDVSFASSMENLSSTHSNTSTKRASDLSDPSNTISEGESSNYDFRNVHELAGGLEDWKDIQSQDVDRYGFITQRRASTRAGTPEPQLPTRTSTVLQTASDSPRRKRGFGRAVSSAASTRSSVHPTRSLNRKFSTRSLNTHMSTTSRQSATASIRAARNRLPGYKDRRWMEEAGDMLTLPPGLADIADQKERGRSTVITNAKEAERSEKWRKMAKIVKNEGGMIFEFDIKNSKLVERTWKGIPDRWRAPAWYSFLATSAKRRKNSPLERDIIVAFHELLDQTCLDDVQIDLDVPRTINSHIMFRRRYRGGQRLLFRVLHCLSLYFPETGYVQGMASIAATLLCYYDEERAFVMLVRMWTLRSMDKLYAPGFEGLSAALEEFKRKWMGNSDVSRHLDEMNIDPTAYGIRWYLTLFNYSIPFAAQLRVWDVFMLLGDPDASGENLAPRTPTQFGVGLDVLHAASSALIDGTREILLDSDFENSMKVLTSWIPIKDEELFMKVAKAEWKLKARRR